MGDQVKVSGVNTGVQNQYLNNWMPALSDSIDYTSINFMPSFGNGLGMMDPMSFNVGILGMGAKSWQDYNNMSAKEQQTYRTDLAKDQIINKVDLLQAQKGASFKSEAAETRVAEKIAVLRNVIHKNEQSQVQREYNNLYNAVADMLIEQGTSGITKESLNPNSHDYAIAKAKINSYTQRFYQEGTNGEILTDALQRYGDSELTQGFKEGFYFIDKFFNKGGLNYKDNLEHITGEEVTASDKTYRTIGRVAGYAAMAITAPLVILGGIALAKNGGIKYAKGVSDLATCIFAPKKWATIKAARAAEKAAVKAKAVVKHTPKAVSKATKLIKAIA